MCNETQYYYYYYPTVTPSRTPVRPRITSVGLDLTPKRINTPTLTLSSTLLPPRAESKTLPTKIAPGTYNIDSQRNVSHTKSPCSVRQNLLNALNQDGSLSINSSNIASTNFEFQVPSATPFSQVENTSNKNTVGTLSNMKNDSLFAVRFL